MVEYKDIHNTFAALSDPTRIAILQQLLHGPARVTELAAPHAMSLNSVSKHVKILEHSNLVARKVCGREHWIQISEAPLADARDWADTMLVFWAKKLESLEALILEDDKAVKVSAGETDES